MADFWTNRRRILSRKRHQCSNCMGVIRSGQAYFAAVKRTKRAPDIVSHEECLLEQELQNRLNRLRKRADKLWLWQMVQQWGSSVLVGMPKVVEQRLFDGGYVDSRFKIRG
jgi:hypothetical protein